MTGKHEQPASRSSRRQRHYHETKIIEWLGSMDLNTLLNASDMLDRLGEPSTHILRRIVNREVGHCQRGRRQLVLGLMFVVVTLLGLLIWNMIVPGAFYNGAACLLLPVWLLLPFLIVWMEKQITSGRRLRNAVTLLNRKCTTESVGELIVAMHSGDERTRAIASDALVVLLPHLTVEQNEILSAKHRSMLYQELYGYNSNLILAILVALERIGDRNAIPTVERLMDCPIWIAQSARIQAAAERCLTALRPLAEGQRDMQTLLRASDAETIPPEEMLRAVEHWDDTPQRELLRAGSE